MTTSDCAAPTGPPASMTQLRKDDCVHLWDGGRADGAVRPGPRPSSPVERQRLVDTYNASLGSPTGEAAPDRRRPAFRLAVEPTVSATGAGLTLGGRFWQPRRPSGRK